MWPVGAENRGAGDRDPVGPDVTTHITEVNPTNPPLRLPVTHMGELWQVGWISSGLPGICSAHNIRHETAPGGTAIPIEGLTNVGSGCFPMALRNPSASSRASSRVRAGTPQNGVVHVNVRHADHYTVIGNHLAQHRSLSLVAIGLAAYIQSLPTGARVGIKRLTERFREGETRIAGALLELEAHGYLERSRVRLASGQIVTRTVSYNRPAAARRHPSPVTPAPEPDPDPVRDSASEPEPVPEPVSEAPLVPEAEPVPEPVPELEPVPEPAPAEAGAAPPPRPGKADAGRREAMDLLARLREDDARLLLGERDVRQLADGVSAWLERGAEPEAVRHVLSARLPDDMRSPAAVIGYRLKAGLPPHLPAAPAARAVRPPDPLQTCDGCERAFRSPDPGARCRDCPPADEGADVKPREGAA